MTAPKHVAWTKPVIPLNALPGFGIRGASLYLTLDGDRLGDRLRAFPGGNAIDESPTE
ncbi:MAG: hypothetical protein KZQ97_21800 [Candidatus Thiodiazotropha sp. (ex Dulcina madagascariensis)]|nr:hypothetical protein [Candidatus Thiodiazotropha sp. (ex Dulcina madagascariensis)]